MGKILKYLKPFLIVIVVIVSLLGIQAMSDLALPDYTAKIVNVGIQQSGVDEPVPEAIREKEMNKVILFLNEKDKDFVLSKYNLLNKKENEDKLEKYSILAKENVYELNTEDKEDIDKLSGVIPKPLMLIEGLNMAVSKGLIKDIPENKDIWSIISIMPKESFEGLKAQMEEKIKLIDDASLKQNAIGSIAKEYEAIGMDVEKMQMTYIFIAGLKMLGIALIGMIAAILVGFLGSKVSSGVGKNLRLDVFKKVISFSNSEFDKVSTASLITRSTNDIQQVQMFVMIMLKMMIYAPIMAIGGTIKVFQTDKSMAWIIGVGIVGIMIVVAFLFKFAVPKSKIVQKLVDKLNLITRESLVGMLVIRAFSTQNIEENRFDDTNLYLTKTNTFLNRIMAMMMPMMMLIMNLLTVIIIWVGAGNIDTGSMQVGNMMAFIQYTMQIMMAFLMLSMLTVMLPRALVSAGRVAEVLNMEPIIKNKKETEEFVEDLDGVVQFRNVSFKYSNAEEYVLNDINFTAKPGQTTAFIGSTGSGKSTIVNLIPRFFDATEGEILVNGRDIKEVDIHKLIDKIGYIPQKGVLFSGTIESNIVYGKKGASKEEIKKAASISQSLEFIEEKEKGFKSEIAQSGANVSGGQKQRLSIARALAKNPKIYIFDDSFSALDLKTDAKLRNELKENIKDSTFLIVAQRISTIINADQIIVLDEGKIVDIGTHRELLKKCEVYRQIALSQLSEKEVSYE
ncbi:ABC transporter ATP-binding protein [uncultured Clostridium sp.]|uniref:ABC transporter ATP-binding protein n=1 Tax=uncultured Clostridium sp. TaxID=59620 RepID=UPI002638432C|nr:ABC transporter ATP-binding protein [uncultured Clostridium sp.]